MPSESEGPALPRSHACRSGPALVGVIAMITRFSSLHRGAVVVPVRVLARDLPVERDQGLHRLREGDDLRGTRHRDPLAEELVLERAQRRPRVPSEVSDLVGRFPAGDHHPALSVHSVNHRRRGRSTVASVG